MAFKVLVGGQGGTTGLHPLDYLSQHDDIKLLRVTEDKHKNFIERAKFLNAASIVFLCLPDIASREAVPLVNNPNICTIDASAASRTSDDWVYGLPELTQDQRERLRSTKRIAVSGCHVSAFALPMHPLMDADIVPTNYPVVASSLTDYGGGDEQIIADYLTANNPKLDSPCPYVLALMHKRLPEMRVQNKLSLAPIFTPVAGNFLKGLAVTIGLHPQHLARKTSPADIARMLTDYYQNEQFICVASTSNVATLNDGFFDVQGANDTNRADLFVFGSDERIVITTRLDNLGEGVAGAAVQCMSVHLGVDEATNLRVEVPVPAVGARRTVYEATPGLAS